MLTPETLPNRFTPQARLGSLVEHYEELYRSILNLQSLRARVQRHMVELPEFFNRDAGLGRLRLRPEVRTPGGLPSRLCWILMNPSKLRFGLSSPLARKPKWPFKRVTIHSSRDLDSAIHWGLMDSRRSLIHRYHRKASILNAASKELTAALSGIRKLLGRFAPRERETARYLTPPTPGLPPDVRRCLWLLRGSLLSLKSAQDALEAIANRYNALNSVPDFFIGFVTDREHRYGRLLWVQREQANYFSSLTDPVKRRLGLSGYARKLLTPYELERRSATRALTGITSVLKRIRLRIPAATRKANEILTLGGYALLADRPATENKGVQEPQRRFATSWPNEGHPRTFRYPAPFQSPHMPLAASIRSDSPRPIDSSSF
jgi:hypothetical protein